MNGEQPSWRKPAGAIAILGIILIWVVLVASLADWIGQLWWPVQAAVYLIAGIVWILPLKPMLRWMETGAWR